MQIINIKTNMAATKQLIAVTRAMVPPGAVVEGSLVEVEHSLRDGATPVFVFVFEPRMTAELEAAIERWRTDLNVAFNTMVVTDDVTTLLKAPRFHFDE